MRVRKISVLALATVAAALSLSACNNDSTDGASSSAPTSSAAAPSTTGATGATGVNGGAKGSSGNSGSTGNSGGTSTSGGTGTGTHSGTSTTCQTAHLSFSASHGMGEGDYLINIKNVGAHTCTMHGFPGVDLKSSYGTVSATRSTLAAPHVILHPGQETHFDLRYPPNETGGSGVTFTTLIVTPPNETHSHTMPLTINVAATTSATPGITVDPVGAGK
ncbi:DUF4232 domain-containing protein [Streptomyces sp. NPDC051976]|uniref:DUF4232 domain-containing protein n=1 Tax=Streptomyces sp. NPDC051976 TaxID=3154947 RepID=UPI003446AB25